MGCIRVPARNVCQPRLGTPDEGSESCSERNHSETVDRLGLFGQAIGHADSSFGIPISSRLVKGVSRRSVERCSVHTDANGFSRGIRNACLPRKSSNVSRKWKLIVADWNGKKGARTASRHLGSLVLSLISSVLSCLLYLYRTARCVQGPAARKTIRERSRSLLSGLLRAVRKP